MRAHDIFGERRPLPTRFRHLQPTQEREQALPATVTYRIRVATVFGIFVDIHVCYPADAVNRMMQQFIKAPPESGHPHHGETDSRDHGDYQIACQSEKQGRNQEQPVQAAVAQRLHREKKHLIDKIIMRDVSHLMADYPFEFLVRSHPEYAVRQTDGIETEGHGVRACIPVAVDIQLPLHPHFRKQAFQPYPFLTAQRSVTLFHPHQPYVQR